MKIVAIILAHILLIGGCALSVSASPARAEIDDGGHECDTVPPAMATCARCHSEANSIEGWRSGFGRNAFIVLFVTSNSATIPDHALPYAWAERCFCEGGDGTPICLPVGDAGVD